MTNREIRRILIDSLQKQIAAAEISKAEIARRAKVPPGYITKLSRGTSIGISIDRLLMIANTIGLDVQLSVSVSKPLPEINPSEVF